MFTSPPTKNQMFLKRIRSTVDCKYVCAKQILLFSKNTPKEKPALLSSRRVVLFYREVHMCECFLQAFIAGEGSLLPSEVSALIQLTVKGKACEVRAPPAFPECRQVGAWVWEARVAAAPASPLLPAKLTVVSSSLFSRRAPPVLWPRQAWGAQTCGSWLWCTRPAWAVTDTSSHAGCEHLRNDHGVIVDFNTADPLIRWDSYESLSAGGEGMSGGCRPGQGRAGEGGLLAVGLDARNPAFFRGSEPPSQRCEFGGACEKQAWNLGGAARACLHVAKDRFPPSSPASRSCAERRASVPRWPPSCPGSLGSGCFGFVEVAVILVCWFYGLLGPPHLTCSPTGQTPRAPGTIIEATSCGSEEGLGPSPWPPGMLSTIPRWGLIWERKPKAPCQIGFMQMYKSQKVSGREHHPSPLRGSRDLQGVRGGASGVHVDQQFLSSRGAVTPLLPGPGSWRAAGGRLLSP